MGLVCASPPWRVGLDQIAYPFTGRRKPAQIPYINMFESVFTLKQHTPMLHFLHDQPGATLRATELKPKLDKWIRKLKEKEGTLPDAWVAHRDDKGHKALDYKMQIKAAGPILAEPVEIPYKNDRGETRHVSFPGYFGNLGDENKASDQEKWFSMAKGSITVTCSTYDKGLSEKIESCFPKFIAQNNFGTRQSKGFGGFSLMDQKAENLMPFFKYHFEVNVADIQLPNYLRIDERRQAEYASSLSEYKRYFKLFHVLNLFYSTIRSGLNQSGAYFKSLMFMYAKAQIPPIIWDKRLIRNQFQLTTREYEKIDNDPTREDEEGTFRYPVNPEGHEERLMRDLLGLSTEQMWLTYGRDKITKKHAQIERFKSPITFKILYKGNNVFHVFLKVSSYPSGYLGESITIDSKNSPSPISSPYKLQFPTSTEFDLNDYLDFCFAQIFRSESDFRDHFQIEKDKERAANQTIINPLANIYEQLRNC